MQQLLGDRMGRDVFFISISIDPKHDTPQVLKAYAERYHAGPGWYFLTGNIDEIDVLSKKLGLWSDPSASADGHTPMLLIGNEATGQWMQTSALDNPAYTVRMIGDWLNSWQTAKPGKSYAEAPAMRKPPTGQYLYSSLCANCHTIGNGAKIGPDLAGALDTRDRAWVTRYTLEPDVMRQQNDPIAMALMKNHGEVRMPNLGLTAQEAAAIIGYVAAQRGHGSTEAPAARAVPAHAETLKASPLVDPAIAIQVALAHDTMDRVRENAAALRNAASTIGPAAAAIGSAAGDLAKQATIADARRAFGTVSEALIAYLKAGNVPLTAGVRIAYCPMLRKQWLQKDGSVENPYYGSRMLACGELTQ
jgi:protein SCO1/2